MSRRTGDPLKAFALPRTGAPPTVIERPVPEPGPGEVLVRTTAALICAWDGHTAAGAPTGLGHEAVGVVEAVGPGVCPSFVTRRVGVEGHGRLAEFFRAPAAGAGLVPLPGTITDHQALYAAGALPTGFAAAEEAGPPAGGTVVVFGQGAVGLSATIGAGRLRGARVIAVEPEMKRQRLALRFGADVVIDPAYEDTAERILELTGGRGADRAIMASPSSAAASAARRGLAEGGRITYARCRPPRSSGARLARALHLIEDGLVDPTVITTHEFPFHRVGEAFARLAAGEPGMIKPVILFPRPDAPMGA
ncbi:zinc-binding dehydrogenase [Streptomyces sp. NBC_00503]|uniref:zinc-binding dehydrogenase n=1 Tax=Streptomyces sp. NBC_00503 TaxID=2903659 RepID=UPI002E823087|nr:zinc-binding dehydrogenase [Streptomyces sp. NBC_00503]WUD81799.1 zinc-binding dehydrogenase [Streptomyces sp. NBC_00503]